MSSLELRNQKLAELRAQKAKGIRRPIVVLNNPELANENQIVNEKVALTIENPIENLRENPIENLRENQIENQRKNSKEDLIENQREIPREIIRENPKEDLRVNPIEN